MGYSSLLHGKGRSFSHSRQRELTLLPRVLSYPYPRTCAFPLINQFAELPQARKKPHHYVLILRCYSSLIFF